jgi:hypothetical protein
MKVEEVTTYNVGEGKVVVRKNFKYKEISISVYDKNANPVERYSSWEDFEAHYKEIDRLVSEEKEGSK